MNQDDSSKIFLSFPLNEIRQLIDQINDFWMGSGLPTLSQYSYNKFFNILFDNKNETSLFLFDLSSPPALNFFDINIDKIKTYIWEEGDNWHFLSYKFYGDQQYWWVLLLITFLVQKNLYQRINFTIKHVLTPEPGSFIYYIDSTDLQTLITSLEQKIKENRQSYKELQKWFMSNI